AWLGTLVQPELHHHDEPAMPETGMPPEADTPATPKVEPKPAPAPAPAPTSKKRHSIFTGPLTPTIRTTVPPPPRRASRPTPRPAEAAETVEPTTPRRREFTGWRRELADQIAAGKPASATPA